MIGNDIKEKQKTIKLYGNLMYEIKARRCAALEMAEGATKFPDKIVEEFCYLQVRMICELLALACCIAHGDIVTSKNRLKDEYKADLIIKNLEKLHPNFFPVAMKKENIDQKKFHLLPVETGYITKSEVVSLYSRCGSYLHKGKVKNFLKLLGRPEVNLHIVREYLDKIFILLDVHQISLFNPDQKILCMMHDQNGNVNTAFAEAMNG